MNVHRGLIALMTSAVAVVMVSCGLSSRSASPVRRPPSHRQPLRRPWIACLSSALCIVPLISQAERRYGRDAHQH